MEQNHFYILLLFLTETCSPSFVKSLSVKTNVLRIQRYFFTCFVTMVDEKYSIIYKSCEGIGIEVQS